MLENPPCDFPRHSLRWQSLERQPIVGRYLAVLSDLNVGRCRTLSDAVGLLSLKRAQSRYKCRSLTKPLISKRGWTTGKGQTVVNLCVASDLTMLIISFLFSEHPGSILGVSEAPTGELRSCEKRRTKAIKRRLRMASECRLHGPLKSTKTHYIRPI